MTYTQPIYIAIYISDSLINNHMRGYANGDAGNYFVLINVYISICIGKLRERNIERLQQPKDLVLEGCGKI